MNKREEARTYLAALSRPLAEFKVMIHAVLDPLLDVHPGNDGAKRESHQRQPVSLGVLRHTPAVGNEIQRTRISGKSRAHIHALVRRQLPAFDLFPLCVVERRIYLRFSSPRTPGVAVCMKKERLRK